MIKNVQDGETPPANFIDNPFSVSYFYCHQGLFYKLKGKDSLNQEERI